VRKKKKKAEAFANHVVMMSVVISKEAIALFYFKIRLDDIEALVAHDLIGWRTAPGRRGNVVIY